MKKILFLLLCLVGAAEVHAGDLGTQLHALADKVNALEAFQCPAPTDPEEPTDPPPPAAGAFNLPALAADAIPANPTKPARGGSFIDPVYKTQIFRATAPTDGGGGRMRHEYSRRQTFNKGSTRYLEHDGSGYWWVYNTTTKAPIRRLTGLAGDAEPIWSATDPATLIFTSQNGGKVWWTKNVETDASTVLFDFTGKTPWSAAASYWTKGEGTTSADGRYLALMATAYNNTTKANTIYGLVVLDTQARAIVSTLDASKWGGSFPDHISMSPSGRWVVPSWTSAALGTRAYARDFSSFKQLHTASEHSDLAYGPAKEDFYVYANYTAGYIVAKNIDTGASWNLSSLYPIGGAKYSVHISGQAFDRPGYVVLSTYADSDSYGRTSPAAKLQPQYRKVWIAELKQGGAQWSLAHIRQGLGGYFDEPQASPNRDLSLVIFSSNLGSGTASDDWIAKVPFK